MSNVSGIINQLDSVVNNFTSKVDVKIRNINESTATIKKTSDKVYARINKFKQDIIENEQKQSAHENLLRLEQIIREQFENHIQIRKTVMGVVRNYDLNLVRDKTVSELSEELWITSSRYWLSYALIALSAWATDNKPLADNALSESMRTDSAKTSLYFCLLNLRFNRVETARLWLTKYFETVVPQDIQEETAILLQAYIGGLFGKDKALEHGVQQVIDDWMSDISLDEELSDELVGEYAKFINNINPNAGFDFPALSSYCTNSKALVSPYLESFKYNKLIALIESLDVDNIVNTSKEYKEKVDAVLFDLISKYDKEENEIREQQEYFKLVIENEGKIDIAKQQYDTMMELRYKKQNIAAKMVDWSIYSESANIQVKKFGMQNTRVWFEKAIDDWSVDFEEKFPTEYNLQVDDWQSKSNGEDQAEQADQLKEHLEKNKFKIKYMNTLNYVMLALFIVGLAAGIVMSTVEPLKTTIGLIIGYAVAGVALIVLVINCLTASIRFNKKVAASLDKLNSCMTELTKVRTTYYDNINKKGELYSLIENL